MLTLELHGNRTTYLPGESIDGLAGWELDPAPKWIEVRLFWHTAGKGEEDAVVVDSLRFDEPAGVDAQVFHFVLPDGPLSYTGTLMELSWGVEVVAHKVGETALLKFTLSPDGQPVRM